MVERFTKAQIGRRDRDPRERPQALFAGEQRPEVFDDALVAALSTTHRAQSIVHIAHPVEADRDGEAEPREEVAVVLGQQRTVCRDRETDWVPMLLRQVRGELSRLPNQWAIDERLSPKKRQIELIAGGRRRNELCDGMYGRTAPSGSTSSVTSGRMIVRLASLIVRPVSQVNAASGVSLLPTRATARGGRKNARNI